MRARREDVSEDLAFVRIRGTKRRTRDRVVPIVTKDQRTLLKYALEHAQGEKGSCSWTGRTSAAISAPRARSWRSRAAPRTTSAARAPPGCALPERLRTSSPLSWATRQQDGGAGLRAAGAGCARETHRESDREHFSKCSADRPRFGGFGGQIGRSPQRVFEWNGSRAGSNQRPTD